MLTTKPFTRVLITVRLAVESGWRVRIRTSRLWINESVGLWDRFLEVAILLKKIRNKAKNNQK